MSINMQSNEVLSARLRTTYWPFFFHCRSTQSAQSTTAPSNKGMT